MAKEMALFSISIITLLVAGYAAYGVNDMGSNSPFASAEIKDYTQEFNSIQTQLNTLTTKLDQLETDTVGELQKIKSDTIFGT